MSISVGFPDREVVSELTAKMLLEVDAVLFNPAKPFIFTSGWASPVYIDCRRLISFPRLRQTIIDFATTTILRDIGFEKFDTVAGGDQKTFGTHFHWAVPPLAKLCIRPFATADQCGVSVIR